MAILFPSLISLTFIHTPPLDREGAEFVFCLLDGTAVAELYLRPMAKSSLTIIDDKNLRGVLAPASVFSKEMLEDIIDLVELSSPESIREDEERIKEADRNNSWIPFEEVERRLQNRVKRAR